ncbi:MAG: hypothetical protein K9M07_03315 [Simkaniaceae bacterium]|nr:hypothetical protein [Simkaniaceae bacterium]MCF7852253.1 hypothetical protein [Simkaniaceae bacterium]
MKYYKPILTLCSFLVSIVAFAKGDPQPAQVSLPNDLPWFTGPLLTPSGVALSSGHYNIEPYLFNTVNNGIYTSSGKFESTPNEYILKAVPLMQFGLGHGVQLDIVPEFYSIHRDGKSFTSIGNISSKLSVQVSKSSSGFFPTSLVYISEVFPTGKYRNLKPEKRDVQGLGSGSFITTLGYVMTRAYHLDGEHYFQWRANIAYSLFSKVHVTSFNSYGGGYGTDGDVYPGNRLTCRVGLEYSLTRNWVLATDIEYNNEQRTKFSGIDGTSYASEQPASNTLPSSYQWSLAPALEYNFNANVGIIGGVWFSFYGRNAPSFISGVIAVNIYH